MGTLFKRTDRGGNSGRWYAEFTDAAGERQKKCTGTRDKRAAEQILAKWETEAAKMKAGLIDPRAERVRDQQLRPIETHLLEYLDSLRASTRSSVHVDLTETRIRAILESAGWEYFREMTPEGVEKFLVDLKKKKDSASATLGHYIQAIRGFTRWARRAGRTNLDPFADIRKPNPESDRKLRRRMILPDEWPWLLKTMTKVVYSTPAEDRRLLYQFAIETGLRADEIRSRTIASISWKTPAVAIESGSTKNRQSAWQHITDDLAAMLKQHCAGRDGSEPIFTLPHPTSMSKMIQKDFDLARAAWLAEVEKDEKALKERMKSDFLLPVNHSKQSIDFHSLRHTCGAWLAMAGVHLKTIQVIMRHSTITLTLDTYGHLMPGAEPDAIAKLKTMFKAPG